MRAGNKKLALGAGILFLCCSRSHDSGHLVRFQNRSSHAFDYAGQERNASARGDDVAPAVT
jgi:hypothetical protein